jgi:hypothetical protein
MTVYSAKLVMHWCYYDSAFLQFISFNFYSLEGDKQMKSGTFYLQYWLIHCFIMTNTAWVFFFCILESMYYNITICLWDPRITVFLEKLIIRISESFWLWQLSWQTYYTDSGVLMDITLTFHSSINMKDDISFVTKMQVHDTRTVTM